MPKAGGGIVGPEMRHPVSQAGAFLQNVTEFPVGMNASYPNPEPLLLLQYCQQVLPVVAVTSHQAGPAESMFASWL